MTMIRLFVLSLAVGGLGLLALFMIGTCWYAINEWRRKAKEGNGR